LSIVCTIGILVHEIEGILVIFVNEAVDKAGDCFWQQIYLLEIVDNLNVVPLVLRDLFASLVFRGGRSDKALVLVVGVFVSRAFLDGRRGIFTDSFKELDTILSLDV